jgi:hypothetical protein
VLPTFTGSEGWVLKVKRAGAVMLENVTFKLNKTPTFDPKLNAL